MIVAVPRESHPGERRVALTPASVASLAKAGMEVLVESGAGQAAGYPDEQYTAKSAKIVASRAEAFAADILLQVRAAGANPEAGQADLAAYRQGQVVIGLCDPLGSPRLVEKVAQRGVSLFASNCCRGITAGGQEHGRYYASQAPGARYGRPCCWPPNAPKSSPFDDPAGTISPATDFVVGVAWRVAGIATDQTLGLVSAYDVRPRKNRC